MVGEKIKKYRTEKGLTQQNLADKLFVTAQAVSRWENGEVEPSLGTITKLAEIFEVTPNEMLEVAATATATKPASEVKDDTPEPEKVIIYKEAQPVLAVCENCNRPIYDGSEIVRIRIHGRGTSGHTRTICSKCDEKEKEEKHNQILAEAKHRRIKSFIFGGLGAAVVLLIMIATGVLKDPSTVAVGIISPIATFTLISCLFFGNNFIGEVIESIMGFSIRMPGVIFSLDLDGIIWLLTVKLFLFLLGAFLSICCFLLAIFIGLALSLVVYPFALVKSIKNPENNDW